MEVEKVLCSVCFEKGETEKLSGDKGHYLLKCIKCDVKVHLRCFGEKNEYSKRNISKTVEEYVFECEKCKNEDNEQCVLCLQSEGYMKKLENKKYIHTLCALFSDQYEIIDFQTMKINKTSTEIKKVKYKNPCDYCNSKEGILLSCNNCDKYNSHLYCAIKYKAIQLIENPDASNFWQFEYIFKKGTIKKNQFLQNRGGEIKILCEYDRDSMVYCLCRKESEENMICCDNCDSWFHFKCVGLPNKDIKNNWFCIFCTEFINNKANFLLREIENDEDLIIQAKDKDWKHNVIHKHIFYGIIDLIFIATIYVKKANVLINNTCSIEILKKHIELGDSIPFKLDTVMKNLNNKIKKYNKVEFEIDNFNLDSFIIDNHFNNEIFSVTQKKLEKLNILYNKFLESTGGIIDESFTKIEEYLKKLKWAIDAGNILHMQTPLLQDLKNLYVKYNEIFSDNTYSNEISMINNLIQDCTTWQKTTKEMLNNHVKKKKELEAEQDILTKIINEKKLDQKTLINKRKERLINNLKTKIPSEEIKKIIENGVKLKINLTKELQSIEGCLREAQEWDEEFSKASTYDFLKLYSVLDKFESILVSTELMYISVERLFEAEYWYFRADSLINNFNLNSSDYYDLNEINYLIGNYQNLIVKDERKINEINNINNQITIKKQNIINHLNIENNINNLEDLMKNLNKSLFNQEIIKIENKIVLLQNLEKLMNGRCNTLDSLNEIENLLCEYNISNKNYNDIIIKKKELIYLVKDKISNNKQITKDEIIEILNMIKESNISLPNDENYLKMCCDLYDWLDKVNFEKEDLDYSINQFNRIVNKYNGMDIDDDIVSIFKCKINIPEIFIEKQRELIQTLWIKRATYVINALNEEDKIVKIVDIRELCNQGDMISLSHEYLCKLKEYLVSINNWIDNYNNLLKIYENNLCDLDNAKLLISLLKEIDIVNKLDLKKEITNLFEIIKFTEISSNISSLIEKNKKAEMEEKDSIESLKGILNELDQQQIKKLYFYQIFKSEIIKYEKWMEKYNNYINFKKNSLIEKIDTNLLEVLIEESKKIIASISKEVNLITNDLNINKNWTERARKLLNSQIDDNIDELKYLFNAINSIAVPDNDLVEGIRILEYTTRVRELLKTNHVSFKLAMKTIQEISSFKNNNDLRKKDFYISLVNQVNLARNIRDNIEILKSGNKIINDEQFEKINRDLTSSKFIIDLPEDKQIVENFSNMKAEFFKKFNEITNNLTPLVELEKYLNDVKKFPIKLSTIINNVESKSQDTKNLQTNIKKLLDLHKSGKIILTKEKVTSLYDKYKTTNVSFPEGELLTKMYDTSLENLKNFKILVENPDADLYDLINLIEGIEIHSLTEEKTFKRGLWYRKYKFFINTSTTPFFRILNNLVYEAEELDLKTENDKYTHLKELVSKAESLIKEIKLAINQEELDIIRIESEKINVDISEYLIEQQIRIVLTNPERSHLIGQKRSITPLIPSVIKKSKIEEPVINEKEDIINLNSDAGIAQGRSKRNINIKIDKDYYYDKEFIENFENKIVGRSSAVTNVLNLDDGDKVKSILKNINISKPKTDLKELTRKNTLSALEKVLSENLIFKKLGENYIEKIAKEVEEDLAYYHPNIDNIYKNSFTNICRTIKELEKYKKVSTAITNGKLNILKVAKYPYGQKFFDKLNKIELGDKNKPKSIKQETKSKEEGYFLTSALQEMKELYNNIEPEVPKKKEKIKPSNTNVLIEYDNGDNDSLKSLSVNDEIRFSPGTVNPISSPVLSKKDFENEKKNIITLSNNRSEKIYDPLSILDEEFKSKKKNVYIPFFYDPYKIKTSYETTSKSTEMSTPTNMEHAILQVWKGTYRLSRFDIKIQMLSRKLISDFSNLPKLPDMINITSKAKTKEVIQYIEKNLNNKNKLILYGWIEIQDENYIEGYKKIVDDYEKNEKTGFILINDIKYYFFPLSQKFPKLYKKINSEINLFNKDVMNNLDKILIFVIIGKYPLPIVNEKLNPIYLEVQEGNMSPITSEDEEMKNSTNLEELLRTDDLALFEDYVNNNFSNLSQEEMLVKLMALDESTRIKLLDLIMNYQLKQTQKQDKIIEDVENTEQQEYLENYTISQPKVNDHLSYLGFSNANTNLLKGEILKNQQGTITKNEYVLNEEQFRMYKDNTTNTSNKSNTSNYSQYNYYQNQQKK